MLFQVIYSAFGSFFIPMSIMLYVYSKIFYVLSSRQSRISRVEVGAIAIIILAFFFNFSFAEVWKGHWSRERLRHIWNRLELPAKLQGSRTAPPAGTNHTLRASRIREDALHPQKQSAKRGQQFRSRQLRNSVPQHCTVQSKSTIKREFVREDEEISNQNLFAKEGNENRSDS